MTKAVAVVPGGHLGHAVCPRNVVGKRVCLVGREADCLGVVHVEGCVEAHVVELREDELLAHAQHARERRAVEARRSLERVREPGAVEVEHLAAKAVLVGVVDRRVVLVDEDDRLRLVVASQEHGKPREGFLQLGGAGLPLRDACKARDLAAPEHVLLGEVVVPVVLVDHLLRDLSLGRLIRTRPAACEVEVDYGVGAAMLHVARVVRLGDGEPAKEDATVGHIPLHRRLEEALQHVQEDGLAEAPGSAIERDATTVHQLARRKRLVHVREAFEHILEVLDAHGQLAPPGPVHDMWLAND